MGKISYRRYTDLPSVIQMLTNKEITLLDPSLWDDKNDSFFLSKYKEKKKIKSLLALCFTRESETYHHWRVFSSGSSGVCVNFDASELENTFRNVGGVIFKEVSYLTINDLRDNSPSTSHLPFIKRSAYKHEKESRALWSSRTEEKFFFNIPFKLASITRITLSPWLHPSLRVNIVNTIKKIDGCKSIPIYRSTLIENETWKSFGASAK